MHPQPNHPTRNTLHVGGRVVARNAVLNLAGQCAPLLVAVAVIPYIIQRIGASGFGILSIAWMLLSYFNLFDLGVSRATTKFVAEYLNPPKLDLISELFWTSFVLQLTIGLAGGLVVAVLVPTAVDKLFKIPVSLIGDARNSFFILALAVPILLLGNLFRAMLESAQRFDLINAVRVPTSVCTYLLAALAVFLGFRVTGIVVLLMLARAGSTLSYLLLCFKILPSLRGSFSFKVSLLQPLMSFGGWVVVCNIAEPTLTYLERFLIASMLSVGALAFYSAPFELISRMTIFPASISATLFPFFSYHGAKGNEIIAEFSVRLCKFFLFALTPVLAIIIFFAHEILSLWLGSSFAASSTPVLQLLAVAYFLNAFGIMPYSSTQAVGRPDFKAILDLVQLPVFAVLSWWLIRLGGINGAATAKVIITAIDIGSLFWFAGKLKTIPAPSAFFRSLSKSIVMSAVLVVGVAIVKEISRTTDFIVILLIILIVFYIISFWKLAMDGRERMILSSLGRSLSAQILGTGGA